MPPLQLSAFFMNHDGRGLTWSWVFLASLVVWVTSGIALEYLMCEISAST